MEAKKQSPQQLEDELIEKMLATYDGLSPGTPSSFFTATSDFTKSRVEWGYICHAPLGRWTPGHDVLFTACPCATELDLAYIRWLISGPFRGFSDKISLKQHVTGCYYIKCDELDKWPSNVLYNFCIATRMPLEHQVYLERWKVFKDAGIDPSLSFLLAINSITLDDPPKAPWDYKVRVADMGVGNYNHHWFDTKLSWARIINGDVIADLNSCNSFKVNPNACKPCNQIWYGKSPQAEFTALLKKDVEELCKHFGLPGKVVPMIVELKASRKRGAEIAIEEPQLIKVMNFHEVPMNFDLEAQPDALVFGGEPLFVKQVEGANPPQWIINPVGEVPLGAPHPVFPLPGWIQPQPLHPPIEAGWDDDIDFEDDDDDEDFPEPDDLNEDF